LLFSIILFLNFVSASNIGLIENSTWQNNLTAVRFSATAFGDIDNDGDLDLALSGCLSAGASDCNNGAVSKIYINNGSTLTESLQWQSNLTGAGYGSLALGDINNDGYLDLVLSGCSSGTETSCANIFSKIYINNGSTLTESLQWQSNLTGIYSGSIKLVDINNDGKLDLALIGKTSSTRIAKIYLNNGSTLTESLQWQSNLTGVRYGMVAFGDINNDGNLDMGLVGVDLNSNNKGEVYINNGTSLVYNSSWSINLKQTNLASIAFGDYNNDGNLDLIETGIGDYLYLYNNTGTTFIVHQKNLGEGGDLGGGRYEGSTAWGDYDNDGDLDFVATGYEEGRSSMYENNKTHFIIDNIAGGSVHSDDLHQNSLAWGDIDNDGDLDLINVGTKTATGLLSKIYISNASLTKNNTLPNPPNSSFSSSYVNNILTLGWGNGSDAETNTSGLYYNLRVGNSTNNNTIVSGVYGGGSGGGNAGGGADGYFGNMMQRKSIALNVQLEANKTYYWYVQTIDTGLAKSNWSAVQNFTTAVDVTKPNITINYPSANDSLHTINPYFIFNVSVSDANLTNITLYADFSGTMTANETNSSGLNATYAFNRNLTGNNDKMYNWYVYACDSAANCQTSGVRSFYLDRAYPIVKLISPSNGGSWTESNTATFSYNVSDIDIANCSLIINNIIVNTSTSVIVNTTQDFTYSLSNGNYVWSVNCSDYVGYINSSANRNLTVSYTPPASSSSGGGGGSGGAGVSAKIYSITNQQLTEGYNQNLGQSDKINFIIDDKNHSLIANSVNKNLSYANLSLNSSLVNFIIHINEEKKFDVNEDKYYDLLVRLNNVFGNRANITIKSIREKVNEISKGEEGKGEKEEKTEEEIKSEKGIKELKEEKIGKLKLLGLIGFVFGLIILLIIFFVIKYKFWKKKESGKKEKNGRSKNR
jgi:hypothetical protein